MSAVVRLGAGQTGQPGQPGLGAAGAEAAAGERHGRRGPAHAVVQVEPAQRRVRAVVRPAQEAARARPPAASHAPATRPATSSCDLHSPEFLAASFPQSKNQPHSTWVPPFVGILFLQLMYTHNQEQLS